MRRLSDDRGKGRRGFLWRRLAGRLRRRGRSSQRTRRPWFEQLDARNLLAASVVDVELVEDTGAFQDDLVTREAAVTGLVIDMDGNTIEAEVQFDHNGDGAPEGTADIDGSNDFYYDPVEEDVALNHWSGELTLHYRVVETLEYDEDEDGPDEIIGDWDTYTFILDRVPPQVIGLSREDGQVTNDSLDSFLVTFDEDIDLNALGDATIRVQDAASGFLPPQTVAVASSDSVEITFNDGLLPAGQYITVVTDVADVAGNVIDPVQVAWRINAPPQIVDFGATQGLTTWTISGHVIDENPENLIVVFDGRLQGYEVVVQANGDFSLTVELSYGGTVAAQVVDSEGLASNLALYTIFV